MEDKVIELRFEDFHEQNYNDEGFCLYVMRNGQGTVLYVGISTANIWLRWFGHGGHMTWDGKVIYGESSIGAKIENHLPDSLNWKIQLWTLQDCLEFCGLEPLNPRFKMTGGEYKDAVRSIEASMIRKLSPALNRHLNLNAGVDTTPESEREMMWKRYADRSYDEIFNQKK